MATGLDIRNLGREEIDERRWNEVTSRCGLPYGQTWWLDLVAPGWRGVVKGDYEYVMPYWERKWLCWRYVMQPPMTQQQGVFGGEGKVSAEVQEAMLAATGVKSYVMQMNEWNAEPKHWVKKRRNRLIDLSLPKDELWRQYDENTRRNVRRGMRNGVKVGVATDVEACTEFYLQANGHLEQVKSRDVRRLAEGVVRTGHGEWVEAMSQEGERLSVALMVEGGNGREVYAMAATSARGMEVRSSFVLMDWLVTRRAGERGRVLDCEGSMVEGVDRFYRGFGAREVTYYTVARRHPMAGKRVVISYKLLVISWLGRVASGNLVISYKLLVISWLERVASWIRRVR